MKSRLHSSFNKNFETFLCLEWESSLDELLVHSTKKVLYIKNKFYIESRLVKMTELKMTKREDCKCYYFSLTEIQDCKHYLHMNLTVTIFYCYHEGNVYSPEFRSNSNSNVYSPQAFSVILQGQIRSSLFGHLNNPH